MNSPRPSPGGIAEALGRRRGWRTWTVAVFALVLIDRVAAELPAGCGIRSEATLVAILRETPEAVVVDAGRQFKFAERRALAFTNADVFWGVGDSMEPLFPSRTALVVVPVPFRTLRVGMTVLYLNVKGEGIVHSLTACAARGWTAQGVGNVAADDLVVTPENLVGVVAAAFAQAASRERRALTAHLNRKGLLDPALFPSTAALATGVRDAHEFSSAPKTAATQR